MTSPLSLPVAGAGLRIALVTGGSRGIGRAVARRLALGGRAVVITGRDEERLARTAEELSHEAGISVVYRVTDARDAEAVDQLYADIDAAEVSSRGRLDVVIANAGLGIFGRCEEITPEQFRTVLDTNLFGVFLACRGAIPRLRRNGGGDIVTIGSLAGLNAFPGGTAYNASKFGLNGFTEALFQEVRGDGIRVTGVLPGSVDTDFAHTATGDRGWMVEPDQVAEAIEGVLALPRRAHVSRLEIRPSRPPKKG